MQWAVGADQGKCIWTTGKVQRTRAMQHALAATCHTVVDVFEAAEYCCNVPALEETCQMTFHETIGANVRGE